MPLPTVHAPSSAVSRIASAPSITTATWVLRKRKTRPSAQAAQIGCLTLNPDVLLLPHFIRTLWDAGQIDASAGTICGKLLSIGPGFRPLDEQHLDSTGIFFTPAMRHFDRGWHEPDNGEFDNLEYVFGASAAAALYRREMIEDVSIDGSFFDPDFFCYREDADVAWRAILQGWRCIYAPAAVSYHVRSVVPGNRRAVPRAINMHSVKNRFLMRIKNASPSLCRRFWLPMTLRDLIVVAGALVAEPGSLPAFWHLARCMPRALRARRIIMSRRRIDDAALEGWFSFAPVAQTISHAAELAPAIWANRNPADGLSRARLIDERSAGVPIGRAFSRPFGLRTLAASPTGSPERPPGTIVRPNAELRIRENHAAFGCHPAHFPVAPYLQRATIESTPMSFQWLQMRITEEQDRRHREAQILERLPRVLDEVHRALVVCVDAYVAAFGAEAVEISYQSQKIRVTVREEQDAKWEKVGKVEVTTFPKLPGLHIDRNGSALDIEVGVLPGDKIFYKDAEEFLTTEELTRRILDLLLFPKLGD